MNYKVKLTKEQMQIIVNALDKYSRIEIGQFRTAIETSELCWRKEYIDNEKLEKGYELLSEAFGFVNPHSSYGIYSKEVCQNAREAYGMQIVLRHQLWKDNPKRSLNTVDSYDLIVDCNLPKIEVEKIKGETDGKM